MFWECLDCRFLVERSVWVVFVFGSHHEGGGGAWSLLFLLFCYFGYFKISRVEFGHVLDRKREVSKSIK